MTVHLEALPFLCGPMTVHLEALPFLCGPMTVHLEALPFLCGPMASNLHALSFLCGYRCEARHCTQMKKDLQTNVSFKDIVGDLCHRYMKSTPKAVCQSVVEKAESLSNDVTINVTAQTISSKFKSSNALHATPHKQISHQRLISREEVSQVNSNNKLHRSYFRQQCPHVVAIPKQHLLQYHCVHMQRYHCVHMYSYTQTTPASVPLCRKTWGEGGDV